LLVAAPIVALDAAVGAVIRATLVANSHGVAWIVKPVAFYARMEHTVGHVSGRTVLPFIGTLAMLMLAPALRMVRGVLTGVAIGTAGALSNALEALIRGSATDYIAFQHIPTATRGAYNLADLEITAGFVIVLVALVVFLIRRRLHRTQIATPH
jgi:lipoprotein signal peptidase